MKKKLLALLIVSVMILSLAACGKTEKTNDYKLGMGIVVENGSKEGSAQVDATVATVVTDANNKIVACRLDVAQTKVTVKDGSLQDISTVDVRTKLEKGDDYNMKTYGGAIAEWYEQAEFFAGKVVGLTVTEVEALTGSEDTIKAGCTISIKAFQEAISKACKDTYAKSFKAAEGSFKLGLAVITSVDSSSASATADAEGKANIYSDFAAVVTDANGKLLADLVDAIQPKITFDAAGAITNYSFNGSKKELKENYNMVTYGNAIAEWYTQATAFENYVVGKDSAGVTGIDTAAADADLLASCTISIDGFKADLAKAIKNAK